jgi:hypothetical protein
VDVPPIRLQPVQGAIDPARDDAVFEEVLGDFLERRVRSRLRLPVGRPAS